MTNNTPRPRWWWWALLGIWLLSTAVDRLWLHADQGIPSWDQAEYLSSALEHGRGLGLIEGGRWQGWQALLDLSPKIPPLSALISGSVMAIAGSSFDQASWVLSLWHGLLLVVVACWGRELAGGGPGLLAAGLLALAPAMADHRVSFTLDLPLTACTTTALWLLGRWQRRDQGGTWPQAISAALAIAAAVLVKQSALLVLAPPAFWVLSRSLGQQRRRWQSFAALALVMGLALPWLHHNWISTLGGTERAVITSGAEEGDPGPFGAAQRADPVVMQPGQHEGDHQSQGGDALPAPLWLAQGSAQNPEGRRGQHQQGALFHQHGGSDGQRCADGLRPGAALIAALPAAQQP